jgi:hypothetical protein
MIRLTRKSKQRSKTMYLGDSGPMRTLPFSINTVNKCLTLRAESATHVYSTHVLGSDIRNLRNALNHWARAEGWDNEPEQQGGQSCPTPK